MANPPTDFPHGGDNCVFTEISDAHYTLSFSGRYVAIQAEIAFTAARAGRLVFDLALDGCLDGAGNPASPSVTLQNTGTTGVLEEATTPGRHSEYYSVTSFATAGSVQDTAIITYSLEADQLRSYEPAAPPPPAGRWDCMLAFSDHGDQRGRPGSSRDFKGRGFLERYLPCNPEFDQHEMHFDITLDVGSRPAEAHRVFVSGQPPIDTTTGATQRCTFNFGPEFSSSCPFIFITPGSYHEETLTFTRARRPDGKIHVVSRLSRRAAKRGKKIAEKVLARLQKPRVLGPFPFEHHTLFITDWDAMEYLGACSATLNRDAAGSLDSSDTILHEFVHAYFGRGVLPANGNAGWFDEAVAQWVARGGPVVVTKPDMETSATSWPEYRRLTDPDAYLLGPMLLGYIAYLLGGSRHLFEKLRDLHTVHASQVRTAQELWTVMKGWHTDIHNLEKYVSAALPPTPSYPAGASTIGFRQLLNGLLASEAKRLEFFKDPELVMVNLSDAERALLCTMNRDRIAANVEPADAGLARRIRNFHFASAWPHTGPDDEIAVLGFDESAPETEEATGEFVGFSAFAGGAGNGGWTDPRPHGRGIRRNPNIPANRATPVVVIGEGFLDRAEILAWNERPGFGVGTPAGTFPARTLKKSHFRKRRLRAWIDLPAGDYILSVRNPSVPATSEQILAGQILHVF